MSVNDFRTAPTLDLFEVQRGPNDKTATFTFGNEDHTLGNSLRFILAQQKETDFVGYSVPHPYIPKMNIRLQTINVPAVQILKAGLKDLEETANILDDVFTNAVKLHYANNGM